MLEDGAVRWSLSLITISEKKSLKWLSEQEGLAAPARRFDAWLTLHHVAHAPFLLLDRNSEGSHFAVEMGALEAERFGGAGDLAVALVEFLEDEVALVGIASFGQGGRVFGASALAVAARIAGDQGG